jgi:hypothetical protein
MNRIQAALTSAAIIIGGIASSASAYVEFLHTNGAPYSSWTAYVSIEDMASNSTGSTAGAITPPVAKKDSFFTDGTFFYKITSNAQGDAGLYNNLIVRYQSLADLNHSTGGEVFNMVNYGMYYDDEIIADGATGRFFRTTRYDPNSPVTIGMYAYNSFADLVNNNYFYASGFANQTVAYDCQFWAVDGKFYRTNVTGKTGASTVTGINVYNSSADLYNGVVAQTIPSKVGYPGSMRFMAVDSSMIPPPVCPGDLNADGEVNAADLAILLSNWGVCPQ